MGRWLRCGLLPGVALLSGIAPAWAGSLSAELQQVVQQSSAATRIPIIIPLSDQVNLDEAAGSIDPMHDRRVRIVEALKTRAITTQNAPACGEPGLLDVLAAAGSAKATNVRRLWIVNAVAVEATKDVISSVAQRANIGEVGYAGNRAVEDPGMGTSGPQWNVERVRSPAAWNLGFRGAGGIVATIDTGGNAAHPDLATNLLRDATTQSAIWRDVVNRQTQPYDDDGHGSHLLGVAVGKNGYGVAPDAKWMACKAFMRSGDMLVTTAPRVLECAQWVLDPDHVDLDDTTAPDPAHVPDVVLSDLVISAAGYCDPFLRFVVRVWRAARILPVWSVGDDPELAPVGAVPSPANDPAVFSVGAADASDSILPTAYRGVTFCPSAGPTAPRLVAPGIDVTAAWTGSSRQTRGGSDVAAAHVAGAVALIRGARPDTRKVSVDLLEEALVRTAAAVSGGQKRLDVLNAVTLEDARFVAQLPPPGQMITGQPVPVTVTLRNDGLTTWVRGIHKLRYAAPPSPWGIDAIDLPANVPSVLPGETVQITFSVTAPFTPGHYPFWWRLSHEGVGGVGDTSPWTDVLVVGYDGAAFVAHLVGCAPPGQPTGGAAVKFRNTGTNTWSAAAGYVLGKLGNYSDPDAIPPGQAVLPNTEYTFPLNFSGPFPSGYYWFQRRMRRNTAWFGDSTPAWLVDTNDCTPHDSALDYVNAPYELRAGQGGWVTMTFRNTGQATWRAGYCVRLESGASPWWGAAAEAACLAATDTVNPGASRSFSVWVVAPNDPGRWEVRYRLYRDDGLAFGAAYGTSIGIPRDHQASAEWVPACQGCFSWFYRYYSTANSGWSKMTWRGDYWSGTQSYQEIRMTSAHPGGTNGAGRFWKSPIAGKIRVSFRVADLSPGCGDGVNIRLRQNQQLLAEWTLINGFAPFSYARDMWVNPDDTVRFIVRPRANNGCDTTELDPLVQVLPPDAPTLGPAPSEHYVVTNVLIEPFGD